MKSILEIISDITKKDKVPENKNLELVIPILSQTNDSVWKTRFPEEDLELINDIKASHSFVVTNRDYFIKIKDCFDDYTNLSNYNQIYKSMIIYTGKTSYTVSYRFIDDVTANTGIEWSSI